MSIKDQLIYYAMQQEGKELPIETISIDTAVNFIKTQIE